MIEPDVLWLETNPSFLRFSQKLINYLSKDICIGRWEYQQSQDEPSSLEIAAMLLHDYLKSRSKPIHLIGHSTGGLLGLLYTRQYPEQVQSLTLLAVGVNPAIDWQTHYYVMRQLFPCSRQIILAKMAHNMFGYQEHANTEALIKILESDLDSSPSPHSIYHSVSISSGGVSVPLMVCGSQDDLIVDSQAIQGWKPWLKEEDYLWECFQGHHFFHYHYPQSVGKQIIDFWQSLSMAKINELRLVDGY